MSSIDLNWFRVLSVPSSFHEGFGIGRMGDGTYVASRCNSASTGILAPNPEDATLGAEIWWSPTPSAWEPIFFVPDLPVQEIDGSTVSGLWFSSDSDPVGFVDDPTRVVISNWGYQPFTSILPSEMVGTDFNGNPDGWFHPDHADIDQWFSVSGRYAFVMRSIGATPIGNGNWQTAVTQRGGYALPGSNCHEWYIFSHCKIRDDLLVFGGDFHYLDTFTTIIPPAPSFPGDPPGDLITFDEDYQGHVIYSRDKGESWDRAAQIPNLEYSFPIIEGVRIVADMHTNDEVLMGFRDVLNEAPPRVFRYIPGGGIATFFLPSNGKDVARGFGNLSTNWIVDGIYRHDSSSYVFVGGGMQIFHHDSGVTGGLAEAFPIKVWRGIRTDTGGYSFEDMSEAVAGRLLNGEGTQSVSAIWAKAHAVVLGIDHDNLKTGGFFLNSYDAEWNPLRISLDGGVTFPYYTSLPSGVAGVGHDVEVRRFLPTPGGGMLMSVSFHDLSAGFRDEIWFSPDFFIRLEVPIDDGDGGDGGDGSGFDDHRSLGFL